MRGWPGELFVPCRCTLPELRVLEQRLERVGTKAGLKGENRFRLSQEDLVTVEIEGVRVERGTRCEQQLNRGMCVLPQRQNDGKAPAALWAKLEGREPFGDLCDDARLGDARNRDRVAATWRQYEARAAIDAIFSGTADADLREVVVRDLTRRRL